MQIWCKDNEEEAAKFNERATAVREALEQYDREKGFIAGPSGVGDGTTARAVDWHNPTEEMKKVYFAPM